MTNPYFLLLLKPLQQSDIRAVASLLLKRSINFDELNAFLTHQQLGPFFYSKIMDLKLQALFPKRFLQQSENQFKQQQHRSRELVNSLRMIDHEFRKADIDYLLLKGLYIAETYWNGIDRRFTWDLDLWVRFRDLQSAVSVLKKCGFKRPRYTSTLDRIIHHITHAVGCDRKDGLSVDLHWTFRKAPKVQFDHDDIWDQRRSFSISGIQCHTPSTEYLLLLILLGIADDVSRGKCRLRSLWDVYLLLQAHPGILGPAFFERRQAEGLLKLAVNVLLIVMHRLDCYDEFPALAEALAPYQPIHRVNNAAHAHAIASQPRRSRNNLKWFSFLQPAPAWYYWLWWAITFPLRFVLIRS